MTSAPATALRRERVRRRAAELGADVFVVTDLANVRYLSGFSGSNAVLVLGGDADDDYLATDGRYRDQAAAQAADLRLELDRDTLRAAVRTAAPGTLAVEDTLAVGAVGLVRAERADPVVLSGVVEEFRAVKDATEIASIERACSVTAAAFRVLAEQIRVGMSELTVARLLESLFAESGAEDRAFSTIVASGPNSAMPHHRPTTRRLERGDLLVVDAGARVDGYHADMTRTFVIGAPPEDWQAHVHGAVGATQRSCAERAVPGADCRALYEHALGMIDAAGHGPDFTHGLGHGVGLAIHEAPALGSTAEGTLCEHMTITVEPGIYLPGRGGVRIEDTLVVTNSGSRNLTEAPRELVVVG